MNKDLDERLMSSTGQGQYRDALNIQVSTSDNDDVGTLQNIMGNTQLTNVFNFTTLAVPTTATVVGSISLGEKDLIYYFVSSGDRNDNNRQPDIRKNYIIEFNTVSQTFKYVFVDIFSAKKTIPVNSNTTFINIPTSTGSSTTMNRTCVRRGMFVTGTFTNTSGGTITHPTQNYNIANNQGYVLSKSDAVIVSDIIYDSSNTRWKIFTSVDGVAVSLAVGVNDVVTFVADSALEFNKRVPITAINILGGNIYWTDGFHEPKKINIERSISGTGGTEYLQGGGIAGFASANTLITGNIFSGDNDFFHTRLVKDSDNGSNLRVATNAAENLAIDASLEYITVIKKSPTQPLQLKMYRTTSPRIDSDGNENPIFTTHTNGSSCVFEDTDGNIIESGSIISISFDNAVDYREGDTIFFMPETEPGVATEDFDPQNALIRAEIVTSNVGGPNSLAQTGFEIRILSIADVINTQEDYIFNVRRDSGDALFEHNFPRFSYRYKYQDGEYSCFAPFSEVAFLTDPYEYFPKKGFNLGMRNQLRSLCLEYYFYPENIAPQDVVEIDLLYKETNNPTVYTIKTLKPTDGHPIWPDLKTFPNRLADGKPNRGKYDVTTDLVHAVVPSNQLLRPFDNVPRSAKAQEVSANRIIYANYKQNYTILKDPVIKISQHSGNFKAENYSEFGYGMPSVKSLRNYQIGVVFSDEYGRETPVLTSKDAMTRFDKSTCSLRNRIVARLFDGTDIPDWAKYYSFYIKETSSEYYSLAMDRWYNAADGNIWLSFPSSERNKLDEETFLILKKAHNSNQPVRVRARYRILAIENEAPDFIKIVKKPLGTFDNDGAALIGNATRGYPLEDYLFILVDGNAFEQVYGDDMHMKNFDKITIKFFNNETESEEYEISKISKLQNNDYKIKIVGSFNEDVQFTSTNNSFASRILDLSFDLIDYEVQNKPEFDGRFFVKIYKDQVLENNIINTGDDIENWAVAASWQLRYINTHNYTGSSYQDGNNWNSIPGNTAIRGPIVTQAKECNSNDSPSTISSNRHRHPTQFSHHTTYNWANGVDGNDNSRTVPSTDGVSAKRMESGSIKAINDDTWNFSGGGGIDPNANEFWKFVQATEDFFIDAASAYSWTSKEANWNRVNGGDRDRPGNDYEDNSVWNAGQVASGKTVTRNGINGSMSGQISNTRNKKGQPSRGIWYGEDPNDPDYNTFCYMDISWSGIEGGGSHSWGDRPWPERLDECTGPSRLAALNFIENLCTPGTRFRFQRDPDQVVYTTEEFDHPDVGWDANFWVSGGASATRGVWGIRNSKAFAGVPGAGGNNIAIEKQHEPWNKRQRWTLKVTPRIGDNGSIHEYNPVTGTIAGAPETVVALPHDAHGKGVRTAFDIIEILRPASDYENEDGSGQFTDNPAIWETEPKENVEVDIYYQIGGKNPIELNEETNEEVLPIGSYFYAADGNGDKQKYTITEWTGGQTFTFEPTLAAGTSIADGQDIYFYKKNYYNQGIDHNGNGSALTSGTSLTLHGKFRDGTKPLWRDYHVLDWNNCWTFFNGAESDRIRDDFNQKQMDNGVKASTVLAGPVEEEHRKHGFIWSGIFNSNSGVNDTNQFIMAEPITKDLNPEYGSIQKLHQRNTDLITLCEDKVLKVLSNKDALFNADGNSNVTATAKVLGAAQPYKGNYGISTNPESFVATPYQLYFGDASRGQICAMSGEGIRTISSLGMTDYFSDKLKENVFQLLGTYDERKKEYNISIKQKHQPRQAIPEITTISYNERSKGWVSFKSFEPQDGISLNNDYYTFHNGGMWKHHTNETRNNFYGTQYNSDVTLIFSQPSSSVKNFETLNYEGSRPKITPFTSNNHAKTWTGDASTNNGISTVNFTDSEYFNLTSQNGWYVDSIETDLQKSIAVEFKDKEGKYYGYIKGKDIGSDPLSDLGNTWHEKEFSTQGIGMGTISHDTPSHGAPGTWTFRNNVSSTYVGSDGVGSAWDTQALGNE